MAIVVWNLVGVTCFNLICDSVLVAPKRMNAAYSLDNEVVTSVSSLRGRHFKVDDIMHYKELNPLVMGADEKGQD